MITLPGFKSAAVVRMVYVLGASAKFGAMYGEASTNLRALLRTGFGASELSEPVPIVAHGHTMRMPTEV